MITVSSILTTTALFSLAMLLVLGSLMRSPVASVREWFGANIVLAIAGALYYAGCAFSPAPAPS